MRVVFKKLFVNNIGKIYLWYLKKPRYIRLYGFKILLHPKVFPPLFTFSTKILIKHIKSLSLKNKTLLELGCGSGIISIFAASKGAWVTASDINETALSVLKQNAEKNHVSIDVVYSDLFDALREKPFDFIVINPPYYPQNPQKIEENAWFCGENFEYFEKLFSQLKTYLDLHDSNVYMILSEDCDIDKIRKISELNFINSKIVLKRTVLFEKNFIFKLSKNHSIS